MSELELANSSTKEGGDLITSMAEYQQQLGVAKDYDQEFLESYAQSFPEEAAKLVSLLKDNAEGPSAFNMEVDMALDDLDALLGDYEALVADKKSETARAKAKATADEEATKDTERKAERGRIVKEISTEINGLEFGAGTTATIELAPDGTAKVTINNPAVGPAGQLVLQSNGKYVNGDTPWTIVGSGCDYDSGVGGSALAYVSDDVYALETQLTGIKEGRYKLTDTNGVAFDAPNGFLHFRGSNDSSNVGMALGEIEGSDPAAFVEFANARHKMTLPSIADLRREDDKVLSAMAREEAHEKSVLDYMEVYQDTSAEQLVAGLEESIQKMNDLGDYTNSQMFSLQLAPLKRDVETRNLDFDAEEVAAQKEQLLRLHAEAQVVLDQLEEPSVPTSHPSTPDEPSSPEDSDRPRSRTEAPAFAPPAAQHAFRERLETNQAAVPDAKDAQKPSADLVDNAGVKDLTLHLPTAQDVRDSRSTDFVGPDGSVIKLEAGALETTQLTLLEADHGQAKDTVYTYQDGTWKTPGGDRLKIYDGTHVAVGPKQNAGASTNPELDGGVKFSESNEGKYTVLVDSIDPAQIDPKDATLGIKVLRDAAGNPRYPDRFEVSGPDASGPQDRVSYKLVNGPDGKPLKYVSDAGAQLILKKGDTFYVHYDAQSTPAAETVASTVSENGIDPFNTWEAKTLETIGEKFTGAAKLKFRTGESSYLLDGTFAEGKFVSGKMIRASREFKVSESYVLKAGDSFTPANGLMTSTNILPHFELVKEKKA